MQQPAHTPWHRSIATRAAVVFTLLLSCATLLAAFLVYRAVREQVEGTVRGDLRHDLDLAELRLRAFTATLADDIVLMAANDPVRELASDTTGDSLAQAASLERVALLMQSFLSSRPAYAQVRLIAADGPGMERVRFDRVGDRVVRVPDSALQAKGDRDYHRGALALADGSTYFSSIDLNREHGALSRPLMPTLRAARTLYSPDGRPVALVVINADLRPLFADLLADQRATSTLVLLRPDGEVVLHPDTSRMFRSELGGRLDPQAVIGADVPPPDSVIVIGGRWWTFRTLPGTPLPYAMRLGLGMDTTPFLAELDARRDRAMLTTLAITLAFVLLGLLLAVRNARRLDRITAQVEHYAAGTGGGGLPTDRADEVGRLARSLERMQQRIDERVHELQAARRSAEEADRRRREVTANLSHDVRTPLQAILGMADGIDRAGLRADDRERLEVIERSARRLHGLVEDLMLHARIEAGKEATHPREVDLHTLLTDIARTHLPSAEAKGLALRLDLAQAPLRFVTDPLALHRIVDNLVANAVKYTAVGQVDIHATASADRLVLEVADSGPGIAADRQGSVFLRFERAQAGDNVGDGSGLGLAITARLVELLGGTIALQSRPAAGSRFTVELPPLQAVAAPAVRGHAPPAPVEGLRVLHVDDVDTNRSLFAHWAGELGWMLTACSDAAAAIAACEHGRFDLMLIDVDLGGVMRGTELALRLRGLRRHRYVPMIAVTAYGDAALEAEALKAGMNARLVKPVDRNELAGAAAFWTGRWDGPFGERADTAELERQYGPDPEALLRVMTRHRRELAAWRGDALRAADAGDREALQRVAHKLRPHLVLLGMSGAAAAMGAEGGDADALRVLDALACCDRGLMLRQAKLVATAGPAGA